MPSRASTSIRSTSIKAKSILTSSGSTSSTLSTSTTYNSDPYFLLAPEYWIVEFIITLEPPVLPNSTTIVAFVCQSPAATLKVCVQAYSPFRQTFLRMILQLKLYGSKRQSLPVGPMSLPARMASIPDCVPRLRKVSPLLSREAMGSTLLWSHMPVSEISLETKLSRASTIMLKLYFVGTSFSLSESKMVGVWLQLVFLRSHCKSNLALPRETKRREMNSCSMLNESIIQCNQLSIGINYLLL